MNSSENRNLTKPPIKVQKVCIVLLATDYNNGSRGV